MIQKYMLETANILEYVNLLEHSFLKHMNVHLFVILYYIQHQNSLI